VGTVIVNYGGSKTFTIKPNTGYSVSSVLVNGKSVSTIPASGGSYTFSNVTKSNTISVSFKVQALTVTASVGTGGTISPAGKVQVNYGSSKTFTIKSNTGYTVASVVVNGATVTTMPATSVTFTFGYVTQSTTIYASFKKK